MNIIEIYQRFPDQESCLKYLENKRWQEGPVCPYCKSIKHTVLKREYRYHCNNCNTSYRVTVGTIFHHTKLDLQKWFLAISLVLNAKKGISARQLGRDIGVTKDTAWYMMMRIRRAFVDQGPFLEGIIEADETYIGGKNKNRHKNKKTQGGQGRGGKDKIAVAGVLQRDGKVLAKKVKDVTSRTLKNNIRALVKKGSIIMTDEWRSYKGLNIIYDHHVVSHGKGEYVSGICHTNTLEGFWSLLKRGVIGQFHNVTRKWLNRYINEFCFRYNNRRNNNIFNLTIEKALRI